MAMNSNAGCGNQKVARSILFTLRAHLFFPFPGWRDSARRPGYSYLQSGYQKY